MKLHHIVFCTFFLLLLGCDCEEFVPFFPDSPPPSCEGIDLVVSKIENGAPQIITIGQQQVAIVPLFVTIRNQGSLPASSFKVSVDYQSTRGKFVVSYSVQGQTSPFYPFFSGVLNPGEEITFLGNATFNSSVRRETVTLFALADSCSGDELMPDFCRIDECNEQNNESEGIIVEIP